jgi:hypothetical protein
VALQNTQTLFGSALELLRVLGDVEDALVLLEVNKWAPLEWLLCFTVDACRGLESCDFNAGELLCDSSDVALELNIIPPSVGSTEHMLELWFAVLMVTGLAMTESDSDKDGTLTAIKGDTLDWGHS